MCKNDDVILNYELLLTLSPHHSRIPSLDALRQGRYTKYNVSSGIRNSIENNLHRTNSTPNPRLFGSI